MVTAAPPVEPGGRVVGFLCEAWAQGPRFGCDRHRCRAEEWSVGVGEMRRGRRVRVWVLSLHEWSLLVSEVGWFRVVG